jgi:hypothetical protein
MAIFEAIQINGGGEIRAQRSLGQVRRSLAAVALPAGSFASMALVWALAAPIPALAQSDAPRPNIVYILADDLGWKDVGFRGSEIKTPNIDQLAKTGAILDQFYVQPMCTPTRASMMTGRYPLRYGLQTLVIPAAQTWGLPTDEWLLPQALKEAGFDGYSGQVALGTRQARVLANAAGVRLPIWRAAR